MSEFSPRADALSMQTQRAYWHDASLRRVLRLRLAGPMPDAAMRGQHLFGYPPLCPLG
jgi:hypothetical protein